MSTGAEVTPLARDDEAAALSSANARALERELAWFQEVLTSRIALHFGQPSAVRQVRDIAAPDQTGDPSEFAALLREHDMDWSERLVLMLALAPHVQPQLLDMLFVRNTNLERGFTEFGGWKGRSHGGFLPSGETAAFLVAGEDLAERFALRRLFQDDHFFHRHGLLRLEHDAPGEPFFSGALLVSSEAVLRLTSGERHKPDFSQAFPAKLITTQLTWQDLVLAPAVLAEIDTINGWIRHGDTILRDWGLARTLKPGYRSLFFGPPGTGKTLTATLIGQVAKADVYRIDLSMIVSKFIGETEKNLAQVFDQAQSRHWILFFDEADALFGKRTATASSNDRYANQEVSYLLQRVEDFPGHVILATNLKGNIDEAFARRFQSLVYFPMPDAEERLRLWQGMLQPPLRLESGVDLQALAEQHELAGGAIANVVRHAAINALSAGRQALADSDLKQGVLRELRKEGRTA